ncbi:transporter substrate-binding domain-containing protein [Desulfobaculum sp. SPO524]|uniref:transporter substrate-binding domain-containing protein n=1 Tax=Desulfobaculum sp. SPO524 TaxID=3378071 RepID=UPI0038529BC0
MSSSLRRGAVAAILAGCMLLALPMAGVAAQKVSFVFDSRFVPMSYVRNQKPMGFEVEILKAALNSTGLSISYTPMKDWDRAQANLAGGVAHVAAGMTRTHLRDRLFIYPRTPTVNFYLKFFVQTGSDVQRVDQLRGKTVATIRDTLYQRLLQDFGGVIVKLYDDGDKALAALAKGEVDAYFGAQKITYDMMRRENYTNIRAVGASLRRVPVYFAVYKGQPELRETIERGLNRIMANGTYDRIYRKWFVPELSTEQLKAMLKQAQDARGAAYFPDRGPGGGAVVVSRSGKTYTAGDVNGGPAGGYTALEAAVMQAVAAGDLEIRAVAAVNGEGKPRFLSGRERQLVREFGRDVLVLWEPYPGELDTWMIDKLLPFGGGESIRGQQ